MRKAILTTRPLWTLLLMVAASTGGRVENVEYWKQYGYTRLHNSLTREVSKKQVKLNNSHHLLFVYLPCDAISTADPIRV